MENISKHITYQEATSSNTAIKRKIQNIPNAIQLANMKLLAEKVFEPLREKIANPIKISSFFRSVALNKAIGGSSTSQHTATNGAAMDLQAIKGATNRDIFDYIKDNLTVDQLIYEFGDSQIPAWVHVSYKKEGNRNQILRAIKVNGKTKYIKWEE
jgi:zinc D-Ala-D-Ala carboxypeptidase